MRYSCASCKWLKLMLTLSGPCCCRHAAWLQAIQTGLAPGQLPLRINAGWGDVPEKLPAREMRLLEAMGVRCEPGFPADEVAETSM